MFIRPLAVAMTALLMTATTAMSQSPDARLQREHPTFTDSRAVVVQPGEWGASIADVQAVCRSAADAIWREGGRRRLNTISVGHGEQGPIVFYQRGEQGQFRVLLDTTGTTWARCAFQFAHEFGHIWFNTRPGDNPQLWFEESLCEMASLFALRRMAQTWRTNPPYSNWRDYAPHLHAYAQQRLDQAELPEETTFIDWFNEHQAHLQNDAHDRGKNLIVAAQLLPLLEAKPHYWQTLAYLNLGDLEENQTFHGYLTAWHDRVPPPHRPFVRQVAATFGIEIAPAAD